MAHRRAAGAEKRGAWRSLVADAADSLQAPTVRAPGVQARRRQPVHESRGTGAAQQAVRDAANQGMFTASSHLRHHIQFPGAWGGANWGSTAGDPATGMLFVRSLEMPSYRRMSEKPPGRRRLRRLQDHERGRLRRLHAALRRVSRPGQTPMRSMARLGADGSDNGAAGRTHRCRRSRRRRCLRSDLRRARSVSALAAGGERRAKRRADRLRLPQNPNRYQGPGPRVTAGSFSAGWYTSNGLPAVGPPWTQLVAYDLNEGAVKWRVPDGKRRGWPRRAS